jgi:hypothetical protein
MDLQTLIGILSAVSSLSEIGKKIKDWISMSPPELNEQVVIAAINSLPADATAEDIVNLLHPFFKQAAGNIHFRAGNDAGGDLELQDVHAEAGSGIGQAGSVVISGGDGGPNGKGGKVRISNSTFKGGDVKSS